VTERNLDLRDAFEDAARDEVFHEPGEGADALWPRLKAALAAQGSPPIRFVPSTAWVCVE
jgi:hypothetical protein